MVLTGYARRVVGDLSPAQVIDPAVVATGDPAEIAAACLTGADPTLAERTREGDLLVVDGVLGGGEGAAASVIALQALGFAAVVCRGAADELCAWGAAYGLPVLVSEAASVIGEDDHMRIDLESGRIEARGAIWDTQPLDGEALAAARRGQLLRRMRRVVEDEGYADG